MNIVMFIILISVFRMIMSECMYVLIHNYICLFFYWRDIHVQCNAIVNVHIMYTIYKNLIIGFKSFLTFCLNWFCKIWFSICRKKYLRPLFPPSPFTPASNFGFLTYASFSRFLHRQPHVCSTTDRPRCCCC